MKGKIGLLLFTAFLGVKCATAKKQVVHKPSESLVSKLKGQHGCVGIGEGRFDDPVARKEDAILRAKGDFIIRCVKGDTPIGDYKVWEQETEQGTRITVEYDGKRVYINYALKVEYDGNGAVAYDPSSE
jgi:hypothetical protein